MATNIYMGPAMPDGAFPENYWPEMPVDQVPVGIALSVRLSLTPVISMGVK